MKRSQELNDKIRKAAKQFAICFGVVAVLLFIVGLILQKWEALEWYMMVSFITTYTGWACVLLCIAAIIVFLIYNQRDPEEMSVDEQLVSHLINVSPEQEKQILRLLKRVAKSSDGTAKINRSEVATFLATLKSMGHLEDAGDYNNLRLWVERETGLKDADKIHFNEAYKRALERKGDTRYTQELQEILR